MEYLEKQKERIAQSGARPTMTTLNDSTDLGSLGAGAAGSASGGGSANTNAGNNQGGGGQFDAESWGAGIGGLLSGVGDLIGGIQGNRNNQNVNTSGSTFSGGGNNTNNNNTSNNTMLWVVLGAFGLIMLFMMFMIMRSSGKASK